MSLPYHIKQSSWVFGFGVGLFNECTRDNKAMEFGKWGVEAEYVSKLKGVPDKDEERWLVDVLSFHNSRRYTEGAIPQDDRIRIWDKERGKNRGLATNT